MVRQTRNRCLTVACCVLLLAIGGPVQAYDNVGAHPAINESAVRIWMQPIIDGFVKGPDKLLSDYMLTDTGRLRKIRGLTITQSGRWHHDIVEDYKAQSFIEWIADGGYTADVPEWFMALRHFYDPTQPEGQRYLTDINVMAEWFVWMQKEHPLAGDRDDISIENPMMDARHWALRGRNTSPANLPNNEYCWDRGVEYMQAAFAERDPAQKDLLFAAAWRSLGETMHLLADMTVPAHVRNDGHPLRPYAGPLRTDAYEDDIDRPEVEAVFRQLARDPYTGSFDLASEIDQRLMDRMNGAQGPDELFHLVASYVNANFFSLDTVFGVDPSTGQLVKPVTGREYPSPKLEDCIYQFGTYMKTIRGLGRSGSGARDVLMLREGTEKPGMLDYLRRVWHDRPKAVMDSTYDCSVSQARVLLPLAFAANVKLVDWFIPRVRVEITKLDRENKTLEGQVVHETYGPYTRPFHFSCGREYVTLYVNGRSQSRDAYDLAIDGGIIKGRLTGLNLTPNDRVTLVVDVGGIPVRSQEAAAVKGWVFVRKIVDSTITPQDNEHRTVAFTCENGRANLTQRRSEKRATEPKTIHGTWARQASWTVPPQQLAPGDPLDIQLRLASVGTASDPPGAIDLSDMTKHGSLRVQLFLTDTQIDAPTPNARVREIYNEVLDIAQQALDDTLTVPRFDDEVPRMYIVVSFDPGFAGAHYEYYEYRYEPE